MTFWRAITRGQVVGYRIYIYYNNIILYYILHLYITAHIPKQYCKYIYIHRCKFAGEVRRVFLGAIYVLYTE